MALPTIRIKSVTIDYCHKNFIAIEFFCNNIFLLLLKILYCNKKRISAIICCNKFFVAIGYCNSMVDNYKQSYCHFYNL